MRRGRWAPIALPPTLVPHALCLSAIVGLVAATVLELRELALLAAVLAALATVMVGLLAVRDRAAGRAVGWLAVALVAGAWAWGSGRIAASEPPAVGSGGSASLVGTFDVASTPVQGEHGLRVRVVARHAAADSMAVRSGTRLLADVPDSFRDRVRLGARVRITGMVAGGTRPDAPEWWRTYLRRERIAGTVRVRTLQVVGTRGGLTGLRDRLRRMASEAAGAGTSGERRAVVRSMAIGDSGGLSEPTVDDFRDAGIWHLLVVSGQNVGVVAMAVMLFLIALGVRRPWAIVIAIAVLSLYCLVCDGGASVARAGVMAAVGLIAELRSQRRDRWYLVLVGLAVLLAANPLAIGDPGLQLSFAAIVGMLLVSRRTEAWLVDLIPPQLAGAAAQAAGATLATAPILIWHFSELSLAGLVVNVVAALVAGPIVGLALAGLVTGLLVPWLAVGLGWVAGLGAWFLIALAGWAASWPAATVSLERWLAAPVTVVGIGVILGVRRLHAVRGAVVARRVRRSWWVAGVGCLVALVAVAWPVPPPVYAWPTGVSVTALDIGQGDAILLRSPDGATALIDTGPPGESDEAPVLSALRRHGVRRLDILAITHDQLDHSGAAVEVLRHVDVDLFVTPVEVGEIERVASGRGVPVRRIAAGDRIALGDWRLDVVWPEAGAPPPEDPNDASLVAIARGPGLSALLTGDAEGDVLRRVRVADVDVLKVSHHGSADPDLPDLLRRVRPQIGLVSVGRENRFGHPVPETVEMLAADGVHVRRTDRLGSVTVTAGPTGVMVSAERGSGE